MSHSLPDPVVEMTGITITFPGVKALDDVDFRLLPGEVHALLGENGAGKSTLIKALTGVYGIDSGRIVVDGRDERFSDPGAAQDAGISTVYQEVNLCANLSVGENVMLGHEVRSGPFINWRATHREAARHLAQLSLDIDPRSPLSSHTIAVQQLCAIARALVLDARVLILDEPTSSLDKAEVAELFRVVRLLASDLARASDTADALAARIVAACEGECASEPEIFITGSWDEGRHVRRVTCAERSPRRWRRRKRRQIGVCVCHRAGTG